MFIPILNYSAGIHLTLSDWEMLGFSSVALDLLSLLIRPGEDVLAQQKNFLRFPQNVKRVFLIFSCSPLKEKAPEIFFSPLPLRERVPGGLTNSPLPLWERVPEGLTNSPLPLWERVPGGLTNFPLPLWERVPGGRVRGNLTPREFWLRSPHDGSKIHVSPEKLESIKNQLIQQYGGRIEFVSSDISVSESIAPAESAEKGCCYSSRVPSGEMLDLHETKWADCLEPLDPHCNCYTCQRFTIAYLHHLSQAGILLVKRLSAIHNLYYL